MFDVILLMYIIVWGLAYFGVMRNENETSVIDSIIYAVVALLWPVMLVDAALTKIYSIFKYRGK